MKRDTREQNGAGEANGDIKIYKKYKPTRQ